MNKELRILSLGTDYIRFENLMLPSGEYDLVTDLSIGTTKKDDKYLVQISVAILDRPERRSPINLEVKMTGIFEIGDLPDDEIKKLLKTKGVQLLYPYFRTLVSNITSNAMIPPINLPITPPNTINE